MKTTIETTWIASARQVFVPYVCKKTGKEKKKRVVIRELVLTGEFIYANMLRVTLTTRAGQERYCAHKLTHKKAPLFQEHLVGHRWAEIDVGGHWERDGKTMDREECLSYLVRMLGRHEGERALKGIVTVPVSRMG